MADLPFFPLTGGGGGGTYEGVVDCEINEAGELIAVFSDGSTKNLGKVVGEDGAVYVPHVDEHNVLSFTVEKNPTKVPDPVDLNPHDEWSGIDDSTVETDYVWEGVVP